jgi:23S rRNA U2552 (ribose-2'-O)-methylase RlmE/FtsJ
MTYYLLPRSYQLLYKQIDYSSTPNIPDNVLSQSLSTYLYKIKEKITLKEKQWDTYKKYTNPYEYIHTCVPLKKKAVSKYKPLSRSYFKMIEIINAFHIQFREPINSFHLAEGPGGFIEAIARMRSCKEDTYIGMTLLDENKDDSNIPAWKKSETFLKTYPNVLLEDGQDGTGNILSLENFEYVVNKYPSKMDLITADGGFDFSFDFNQQECAIGKLLFAQVAFAICLQKLHGKFILKIFDSFMQHTVDIIYLLSSFYEKVYIMKPQTSRYANSEKYIVCSGFLYDNHAGFYVHILKCFEMMIETNENPLRFMQSQIPSMFMNKLEEYNAIFGQKQIQNIYYTLALMENKSKYDKIDTLVKTNIEKSMEWCKKYNIPCNILNINSNIFLSNSQTPIEIEGL